MNASSNDTGVILALAKRFNEQRLPRAIALKEKVDEGECLSEHDIAFLDGVLKDANRIMPLAEKHPQWQSTVSRAISLYKEITDKGLENQKKA